MRLLTMLLMLCLSLLSAADAQQKCDRSLIKGVTNEQIQFDDATKTLTCVEKEKSFTMLHFPDIDKYKSIPYVSLKCDKVGGWMARMPKYGQNDVEEHTISDASSAVNIDCIEYCDWTGGDIVMEKTVSSGLPTIVLKPAQGCRLFNDALNDDIERMSAESAHCTPYKSNSGKEGEGWLDQNGQILRVETSISRHFRTKCYNDGQLICDQSLIKEATNAQIQFDVYNSKAKKLTCVGKTNSLMAIHILSQDSRGSSVKSEAYPLLICREFGWEPEIAKDGYFKKLADASAILNIVCVEYCASTGTGFNAVIKNSFINIELPQHRSCVIYHELKKIGMYVYCDPYKDGPKGWLEAQKSKKAFTSQIDRPQHFDVRCNGDPSIPCSVDVSSHRQMHVDVNMDISTKTATCHRTSENALTGIIVNNMRFRTLQCDESSGWKTKSRLEGNQLIKKEYKVAEASTTLPVKCVEYCQATGDGIQFNQIGEGAEVTCATDFKLHHNNQVLNKATCDLSGEWTLEKANSEKTKDKSGSFECRPTKCYMPNIEGARFDKTTKTLTCDSNGNALIAIQVNSELFTSVSCDIVGGWSGVASSGGKKKFAEAAAQLDAKCVKYCTPSEQSGQVQSVSGQAHSTQFTCNGNIAEALEIRLNEKIVAPPLECHMDRGYTDASGVKLAGPLDTVKLDCAIRPAPTTTTSSQQLPTSTMTSNDVPTTTHGSKTDEAQAQSSVTVVCASIGGVFLLIIAIVVIVIVLKKRRPENNSERPKAGSKEKHRKGNEKSGGDQNSSGQ